jgi:hypothetical protein
MISITQHFCLYISADFFQNDTVDILAENELFSTLLIQPETKPYQ